MVLGGDQFKIVGYADADFAGDVGDRKSTSGNITMLGNGAITWLSKKQPIQTLSTTEAEYLSLTSEIQEVIWIRSLLSELGYTQDNSTTIYEDNKGTIELTKNPKSHSRTKHIDIKYHFNREKIGDGTINLIYCPTNEMLADLLTKALPKPLFEELRGKLGLNSAIKWECYGNSDLANTGANSMPRH